MKASDISSKAKSPVAWAARRSPSRFRLAGPTVTLDPRINAIRPDIADVALADRYFAPHYASAQPRRCIAPAVPMRADPSPEARAVSELRLGDGFALLDNAGGWAWGYSTDDRYVGYVPSSALSEDVAAPQFAVTARTALVFAAPDIKAPIIAEWPMGARFTGTAEEAFLRTDAGYVHHRHAAALAALHDDPATVAERLVGTPYRWGGRSGAGIDCSGLVQLALQFCGQEAPRDSDQQRDSLGSALPPDARLERGDLVFFPGHVGIMADTTRLIHANAFWMAVTVEPLADVIGRVASDQAEPVTARRRLR